VAERLRAHRTRRPRTPENQPALPGLETAGTASAVAARVAERYARIPSWREALAAEAAAKAAAEAAAQAEAEARRKLAAHLEAVAAAERAAAAAIEEEAAPPPRPVRSADLSDSLFFHEPDLGGEPACDSQPIQQDPIRYSVSSDSLPAPRSTPAQARVEGTTWFRPSMGAIQDPMEEATVEPARPLFARVIEFPRELVAPRKARPRIAEGPLLDPQGETPQPQAPEAAPEAADYASQLRIFEAEPEMDEASREAGASRSALPEWHSIHLDSDSSSRDATVAGSGSGRRGSLPADLPLHVASFGDRIMASIVDVALTLAAFLLFVLVFAACTTHPPAGRVATAGATATLLVMWVLYQLIFFSLSSATPGMMYAKIALCTFDDDNPTRQAMRGRIAAQMLSALPLGLGFVWAVFDEDALGWHDRITQTYQRSYRDL
jgi:uncharacterized RDD family membrane protein YckC